LLLLPLPSRCLGCRACRGFLGSWILDLGSWMPGRAMDIRFDLLFAVRDAT
jgi:hypothetical protein